MMDLINNYMLVASTEVLALSLRQIYVTPRLLHKLVP